MPLPLYEYLCSHCNQRWRSFFPLLPGIDPKTYACERCRTNGHTGKNCERCKYIGEWKSMPEGPLVSEGYRKER